MVRQPIETDVQDELTLRVWESDESVKADLLLRCGTKVEIAISRSFPSLSTEDIEDVIAEAIRRFWLWREKFDPQKAKLFTMLYKFSKDVATEYVTGRLKWQQERLRTKGVDAEFFDRYETDPVSNAADEHQLNTKTDPDSPEEQKALIECFDRLPAVQKKILTIYALARGYELDTRVIGEELGDEHKDGVPIPPGTIRVYKSRGWKSIGSCMKNKGFDLSQMGLRNE